MLWLELLLLMECQFSGNVTNIPAVLQPSSTCQWFWLLTVCFQCFTHQPIVFLRCEANAYFIGSGCAGSLFFLLGLPPSFLASRGFAVQRSLMRVANWRKKKRLLAVYPMFKWLKPVKVQHKPKWSRQVEKFLCALPIAKCFSIFHTVPQVQGISVRPLVTQWCSCNRMS